MFKEEEEIDSGSLRKSKEPEHHEENSVRESSGKVD